MDANKEMDKFYKEGIPMLTKMWLLTFSSAMEMTNNNVAVSVQCADGLSRVLLFGANQSNQQHSDPSAKYFNADGSIDITSFLKGFGDDGKK